MNRAAGYTLVELVVVMAIFLIVMGITTVSFNRIVATSGQVTKSAQSDIEGMIGLELMRGDLELAGFGLPWKIPDDCRYTEAASEPNVASHPETDPARYNDDHSSETAGPPRPIAFGDNKGLNDSDYLVLKGSALGESRISRRWSYLTCLAPGAYARPTMTADQALGASDSVILLSNQGEEDARRLVTVPAPDPSDPPIFVSKYGEIAAAWSGFAPKQTGESFLVYGITDGAVDFPYNRADYFVAVPPDGPSARCAPNTGVLYKAVLRHGGAHKQSRLPLLDCVADFQVVFRHNGLHQNNLPDDPGAIRNEVREVRAYILTHEGGYDPSYRYPSEKVAVGEFELGHPEFELAKSIGPRYEHYRWKVFSIVVQSKNLRQRDGE